MRGASRRYALLRSDPWTLLAADSGRRASENAQPRPARDALTLHETCGNSGMIL